ncbi:hypothetical protein E2C01_014417 [Portunus trituberculatus]|uniref:Uncharacterized protein n=1 Tax=Portunus trituberculatus TaxID=210409 RepID=A0A5B7DIR9_PORTR|nr:hypothetical protein [Portunus trituberculatus]
MAAGTAQLLVTDQDNGFLGVSGDSQPVAAGWLVGELAARPQEGLHNLQALKYIPSSGLHLAHTYNKLDHLHVKLTGGIKKVKTVAINLQTSIDPS